MFHLAGSYPYREAFRAVYERVIGRPPAAAVEGG
jgi:hypothetical protein